MSTHVELYKEHKSSWQGRTGSSPNFLWQTAYSSNTISTNVSIERLRYQHQQKFALPLLVNHDQDVTNKQSSLESSWSERPSSVCNRLRPDGLEYRVRSGTVCHTQLSSSNMGAHEAHALHDIQLTLPILAMMKSELPSLITPGNLAIPFGTRQTYTAIARTWWASGSSCMPKDVVIFFWPPNLELC